MRLYKITHSQNGWEYEGNYFVKCKYSCERRDMALVIDSEIEIKFDEEFYVDFIREIEG